MRVSTIVNGIPLTPMNNEIEKVRNFRSKYLTFLGYSWINCYFKICEFTLTPIHLPVYVRNCVFEKCFWFDQNGDRVLEDTVFKMLNLKQEITVDTTDKDWL